MLILNYDKRSRTSQFSIYIEKPVDDKNLKLQNGYCEINSFNILMIVSIVLNN